MLNHLLNTALLGTAKHNFQPLANTPAALQHHWQQLAQTNPEDRFYQYSALSHAYQYGGQSLGHHQHTDWQAIPPAPHQSHEHLISPKIANWLIHNINHRHKHLLQYAFHTLNQHQYTLSNDLLPPVIQYLQDQSTEHLHTYAHTPLFGARGLWLLQQSQLIDPPSNQTEDDWELTTFAQRQAWLAHQRHIAPDNAREQLAKIWANSSASHRHEYIALLANNLSINDSEFLIAALKDRSKNVKETAQQLLLKLPNSPIVQQFQTWLTERLNYHHASQQWQYHTVPFTPDMKAAGIDEISPHNRESDAHYQLRQIITKLPLNTWATILQCSETEAAELLTTQPPLPNIDWQTWLTEINHPLFTQIAIKNLAQHIDHQHLIPAFLQLSMPDKEHILTQHTLDSRSCLIHQIINNPQDHNQWGEPYSLFVLNHLTDHPDFHYANQLEYIAAQLKPTATIIEWVNKLPTIAEQQPENKRYLWKWCHPLHGYFQQKHKLHILLEESA